MPTPSWCLQGDFARAGIDRRAIRTITDRTMAENAAGVTEGAVDVAQMFEPFACRVEDAGGAVWHAQANRGPTAYTSFYATEAGIAAKHGTGEKPLDLVFHGGSGSTDAEIEEAVRNGVIKMNIDTDTQYAYSRSVADSVLSNYSGFLKVDGEVGNKKVYDPRAWGKAAEKAMAARVVEATRQLGSAGWSAR